VAPKQTIQVERLSVPEGEVTELNRVLFIGEDDNTIVGNPTIEGARVVATSLGEIKGKKATVFKYKPKIRYQKKRGHRQRHTKILVNDIIKG